MNILKKLLAIAGIALIVISCNKDETVVSPTIDNEALTTVQLKLTNVSNPADIITAQWEQLLDSNGNPLPADASQANLDLRANTVYTGYLQLLDKTQNPALDVSEEIKERGNYHLFFYQPLPSAASLIIPAPEGQDVYPEPIPTPLPATAPLNLTVDITDHDTNPQQYPLGLETKFTTGNAGTGWVRVVLRHQPNLKDGTYAPGSTDLDVGFNVTIQ